MKNSTFKRLSIVGVVGLPAAYGGFETLAENLVRYSSKNNLSLSISVFCSGKKAGREDCFSGAKLIYIPLSANGVSSVLYDIISMFTSARNKDDVMLVLGVSGAIAIPFIRLFTGIQVITNIDGIEWKREKWGVFAKYFLRISEYIAVKFSHVVISDNAAIQNHIAESYGCKSEVIAYGGDHALVVNEEFSDSRIPDEYFLGLCRIEPENNVDLILEGVAGCPDVDLVFIGNWDSSEYGRQLKRKYQNNMNIHLFDPIYDLGVLGAIRINALAYLHGHSAGGTNPSLVEVMHFGTPVVAFNCDFNKYTTHSSAIYFSNCEDLKKILTRFKLDTDVATTVGLQMKKIASKHYSWDGIGASYFKLVTDSVKASK